MLASFQILTRASRDSRQARDILSDLSLVHEPSVVNNFARHADAATRGAVHSARGCFLSVDYWILHRAPYNKTIVCSTRLRVTSLGHVRLVDSSHGN